MSDIDDDNEHDWGLKMPFWIDTDGYTERDKEMFVCGVEFQMLYQEMQLPAAVVRTIHTENESRARMMAGRLKRAVSIKPSGVEGWSYLEVDAKEPA